jgi:hydroxyethylthiazole kinase-like uncharacterized protein yjeF
VRLASIEQCKKIDELSQTEFHLPSEVLMEAAGVSAAREIEQAYFPEINRGRISIVCGPGNNGGDGLVIARHLHSAGYRDLAVFLLGSSRSKLYQEQLTRLHLQGINVTDAGREPKTLEKIKSSSLIVDAIFGIGLNQKVSEEFASAIQLMNQSKVPIVSIDTPSGLDCDRGVILGAAVRASMTLSFGLGKPGFFISEGPATVGRLRILPIGFPYELLRKIATTRFGFTDKIARRYLPKRSDQSNKTKHGHALLLAGRSGSWGAAVLSATSAFRMGAGYVSLASFDDASKVIGEIPEAFILPSIEDQFLEAQKFTAVGIGPGLGVNEKTAELLKKLMKLQIQNVVVDADAITVCAQYKLFPLPKTWVITPHAGELSRILSISSEQIEQNRIAAAEAAAKFVGCHVLLKGYRSVLADDKRSLIILSGNSALAKAGTGDVLTGMITGLLAQNVPVVQATATAAYLHGRLADEWVKSGSDKRSLLASDLRDQLPSLMARLMSGALA